MSYRSAENWCRTILSVILVLAMPTCVGAQQYASKAGSGVFVNRVELQRDVVLALSQNGIRVVPGDYWYDPLSGLFGMMGGPGLGFTMPGMRIGGELPANASGGGTNVFVNGRELHPMDVMAVAALVGGVYPGRYWLRWDGWFGYEGGPAAGNLIAMAQQSMAYQGGAPGYNESTYFGHLGSDGQTSYFFDPGSGCSVISGGGVSC